MLFEDILVLVMAVMALFSAGFSWWIDHAPDSKDATITYINTED